MDVVKIKEAIRKLKETSPKKKFIQSFDLVIALKGLNLKKPEEQIDLFIPLHFGRGKPVKICAFVGPELKDEAGKVCDTTIFVDDFEQFRKDKKALRKLANNHAFFIAQANIMPKVAAAFGKVLGTRGKMPNPKAGCVVPPKTNLQPLYDRLQKTANVKARIQLAAQVWIGREDQSEDEVADNIKTVVTAVLQKLPQERDNIKDIALKLTMSKPIKLEL
ncbi:hypothetical protein HY772_05295 [Candidatus Woesearchaeota archaeon]|nr:hypothetical protein [Candidatus Woesearchaeota archaeon]